MKPFVIANPCHESWDAMRRVQGARHCASCEKHVVDLAHLTEAQVRGMLTLTDGKMCARQTVRDGALVTLPPAPIKSRFPIRLAFGGAVVASALAACSPANAAAPDPLRDPIVVADNGDPGPQDPQPKPNPTYTFPDDEPLMGDIAAPEPNVEDFHVTFEKHSARLTKAAQLQIANAASALAGAPWVQHVRIEGHVSADELGKKATALAIARAKAVQALFVKQGIDPKRITAVGVTTGDGARNVSFTIDAVPQ